MRISPVGYLFNSEDDIAREVSLATIPSHCNSEAINDAITVSLIIYYGRMGLKKEEIINLVAKDVKYRPFTKFNTTCEETLPNCLYALFSSDSFEEAIQRVISYGGDTDTNACIVGAMAESLYGVDDKLVLLAKQKIPQEFNIILEKGYNKIEKLTLH